MFFIVFFYSCESSNSMNSGDVKKLFSQRMLFSSSFFFGFVRSDMQKFKL